MKALYISMAIIPALIFSCGSPAKSDKTKTIAASETSAIKPIEGLELPVKTFTVKGNEASTIDLPNGGSIVIPANAFVDENGKPVSGKVDIAWQEFHSLADIALSGIPMQYDSAGVSSDLISGGMFTIDGSQNKKPVEIAPGKEIEVNLATSNPQLDMNFYDLNEKTGKWTYKTSDKAKPKKGLLKDKKVQATSKQYITLDVLAKIDKQKFPELDPDQILGWEVTADDLSKDEQKRIKSATCSAVVTEKSDKQYTMTIKNKFIEKNISARPITFDNPPSKNDARKAIDNQVLEAKDYKILAEKGELIRSISIPGFGTYNWDCMNTEPRTEAYVALDIPNHTDEEFASFFLVAPERKRIVRIESKGKILLGNIGTAFIVAITKRKHIFTVRDKDLSKIRQNTGQDEYSFVMNQVPGRLNRPEEMERYMDLCK